MRPGQQNNNNNNNNKRMRGRNRKGPNPLTRSFESNGPDVKIRGTALHIAEKYVTLARDAQSSGDRVMAENYLQHAEHYFRVIAAAQVQNPQPGAPFYRAEQDDDGLDEEDDRFSDRFGQHDRAAVEGEGQPSYQNDPQPFVNGNGHYQNGGQRERGERQEFRSDNRDRQENRQESRQENRQENRQDARPDNRQQPPQEGRQQAPQENRQESRGDGDRAEARGQDNRGQENRPQEGRGDRPFRQNREGRGERRDRGERPDRSALPRFVTGEPSEPPATAVAAEPPAAEPPVAVSAPQPEVFAEPQAAAPTQAAEVVEAGASAEIPAAAAGDDEFRPRRRRTTRARTRRTDADGEAEPTLAIIPATEE